MEQERTEAENRRIMEFFRQQQHMEESRMAKNREREALKDHLYKTVEPLHTHSFTYQCQ